MVVLAFEKKNISIFYLTLNTLSLYIKIQNHGSNL
jgi:hypothetical protein